MDCCNIPSASLAVVYSIAMTVTVKVMPPSIEGPADTRLSKCVIMVPGCMTQFLIVKSAIVMPCDPRNMAVRVKIWPKTATKTVT